MSQEPPAEPREPRVSADGKFYWDGQRWAPMQQAPPAAPRQGLRARLGMTGAVNSCVGYGCLIIAALFVIGAITAVCTGNH